jgi:hypothetical protein
MDDFEKCPLEGRRCEMSKGKAPIALALILVLALGFGFGFGVQSVEAGPKCGCYYWCPPAEAYVEGVLLGDQCNVWPQCYQCDIP